MNNVELAVHFFVQIAIILLACRVTGAVAVRFGQPQVVAEMITGVLLGPSLFGLVAPGWQSWVFPWDAAQQLRDTSCYLFPVSQLGLALYMFVVGMEFRMDLIRQNLRSSVAVSFAGMSAPFTLGLFLAFLLHRHTGFFSPKTSLIEAMLFLGAAMCITAFPMLARIIHFKGLTGTRIGTVAIGAGAIDDVMAWVLLAIVLSSFDGHINQAFVSVGGAVIFLGVSLRVIRPILLKFEPKFIQNGELSDTGFVVCLAAMACGAWFTDLIGLHAVFGAFLTGAAMPRGIVTRDLVMRIQPITVALLLPLFFTYSGLNTQINLLNSWDLLGICLAVILVAIVGKWVACAFAAYSTGIPVRESMGIGILMNARGLMELIIINIGLQRGIITEELFSILVIMAIITTLMASPIFDRLIGKSEMP